MIYLNNKTIIILVAAVYTILFNTIIIEQRISILKPNFPAIERMEYLFSFIYCIGFFSALSINRVLFICSNIIIFVISSAAAYFIYYYHIKIDANIITILRQANLSEIVSFLNMPLILLMILPTGIITILSSRLSCSRGNVDQLRIMQFLGICFMLAVVFLEGSNVSCKKYMPFNIVSSMSDFVLPHKLKFAKHDFTKTRFDLTEADAIPLNIVLVIGESARADHFHINGYGRETTPNLDNRTNLISYKDVTSCGNLTAISVPCMLSQTLAADFLSEVREASFISIFRQLDFNTIWISNQRFFLNLEDHIYHISQEAEKTILTNRDLILPNNLDENILVYIDSFLHNHDGKNLIIIHSNGSHHPYYKRYPDKYKKFIPTCEPHFFSTDITNCPIEHIINSYDNSILYTDYFLNEVIKRFEHKNALFIYVSDHGESLGEDGHYFHGYVKAKEQYHVPMLIWASRDFISANQQRFQNLQNKSHAKLSHDNLFPTILDCAGIESEMIDKALSLCR
jgi:glucan phosphoethanolaminetransferase (alkaline phosphatase superfamily)